MLDLVPAVPEGRPLVLLALAAHPDDLEIGCAGTLLQLLPRLAARGAGCRVHSVVLTGDDGRVAEARAAGAELLGPALVGPVQALGLDDGFLPARWGEAKSALRAATAELRPDWVLAPRREDLHQDHRLLAELAWQLYRGATIWEYEIPKWEGDLGRPSLYVPLDEAVMAGKVELLRRHYASQRDKPWYDEEVFRGLCRLRGVECGARYAEAFDVRRTVVR